MTRLLVCAAACLALAPPAAAAPPPSGLVDPGARLGGLRLGMTKAQVLAKWGRDHGVCRGCKRTTWYFTYRRFQPQGAAVELTGGRVSALWTLWSPTGWRTTAGLHIGDPETAVTDRYGPLVRANCLGYYVLSLPKGGTVTRFEVVGGKVWGFELARRAAPACR
jgi:hypothetical protein